MVSFDVDADRFQLEYEVVSDDDDIISSTASVSGISESVGIELSNDIICLLLVDKWWEVMMSK